MNIPMQSCPFHVDDKDTFSKLSILMINGWEIRYLDNFYILLNNKLGVNHHVLIDCIDYAYEMHKHCK